MRCWPVSPKVSTSYPFYCILWIVGRRGILNDQKFINKRVQESTGQSRHIGEMRGSAWRWREGGIILRLGSSPSQGGGRVWITVRQNLEGTTSCKVSKKHDQTIGLLFKGMSSSHPLTLKSLPTSPPSGHRGPHSCHFRPPVLAVPPWAPLPPLPRREAMQRPVTYLKVGTVSLKSILLPAICPRILQWLFTFSFEVLTHPGQSLKVASFKVVAVCL